MTDNIKIKYINLDRREDRKEKFIKEMEKNGITQFDRFSAIDGRELELTDDISKMFEGNTFNWRKGIIGVSLSHLALWKELSENNDDNIDYYLIFEDDVWLQNDFKNVLEKVSAILKGVKYPLVFLGYHTPNENLKLPYKLDSNYNKNSSVYPFIYPITQKKHIWGGLFGYIINKNLATQFVNDIYTNGLKVPIDTYVLEHNELFMTYPETVKSQFMTFDNNVDSDIQYELTGLKDNYIFIPGKDSPDNDLGRVNTNKFEVLKHMADNTPGCVAFNTLGFLKHALVDPSQYIDIPVKQKSGIHGLYVKKNKN